MNPTRVVIVGAGFGGLAAAKALRKTPAEVVLIDRTNHNLFQPLLYQVATSVLSPARSGGQSARFFGTRRTPRWSWEKLREWIKSRSISWPATQIARGYLLRTII